MTGEQAYFGPAIWIRVKHRFQARMTEWMLATIMTMLGFVTMLPQFSFDNRAWASFRVIFGSEANLAFCLLFLGFLRLVGLIVNGSRKHVTPKIRVFSAACGMVVFVGISIAFIMSGVVSWYLAIYPVFALVEILNMYRAAHDVGETYGAP